MKERIKDLLQAMNKGTLEREELVALTLLSAFAGESIFLLGLPGVGKSMVARRLKMAFSQGQSFEYLMSRFSTPDEIFGPVSISKLKDEDTYERITNGYLPTADVVFLDEIWKAGPAIQNSLLTVLNEKIFHNGMQDIQLPLKAVISASNELPAEGEGLEALWDRFLIRYIVQPINNKDNFISLISERPVPCIIPPDLQITSDEFMMVQRESQEIAIPYEISELIFNIRKSLIVEKENMYGNVDVTQTDLVEPPYVSDRRWKKIVDVLKTAAFLNDRTKVDHSDCLLLMHMLWDKDAQTYSINKLLAESIVHNLKMSASIIPENISFKALTKPVGDIISPDGIHYVFTASGEDILISKTDYNRLQENEVNFAEIDDNNIMQIVDYTTTLRIRKTADGLSVNSFSFPLKRTSKLRSGSENDMMATIRQNNHSIESYFATLTDDNIFLLPYEQYSYMQKAFEDLEGKLKKGY